MFEANDISMQGATVPGIVSALDSEASGKGSSPDIENIQTDRLKS